MSNQKLGILAVIAAVMVLWAVVQANLSSGRRAQPSGPAYLIQGMDQASIDSITVGEGDDMVRIERKENQFVVVNEGGYAADMKQINDLISKSLDIKTSELYTDNPKNHEELKVTEEEASHVVKFFKSDGSLLAGVVIGQSRETGQGTYVRLSSSDNVYVAQETPWFRSGALDYVNQEIVAAKREDVNNVTVRTPGGSYTLQSKSEGNDAVMIDLPPDRKLKESDAKSVLTSLTSLRFDDVNKPADLPGLTFDHEYICRLDDSTEYRLKLAKKEEKTYLQCSAEYTDKTPVTIQPNKVDSPEELKAKEARLLAQEGAQKFTLRHKGWVYEIPDWKAKYLTMNVSDLFEEEEEEEPAEDTTAEPTEPVEISQPVEPNQPA